MSIERDFREDNEVVLQMSMGNSFNGGRKGGAARDNVRECLLENFKSSEFWH